MYDLVFLLFIAGLTFMGLLAVGGIAGSVLHYCRHDREYEDG